MIIGRSCGGRAFCAATVLIAATLSGCGTGVLTGKVPVSVWQCPDGSVDLAHNEIVVDPYRVRPGQGTSVRGINGWEGEISGVPLAGSAFSKLLIGMRPREVAQLLGPPGDYGTYLSDAGVETPYYFGSDRSRYEMTYRGRGRLVFTTQSTFGAGRYLTWIIHAPQEQVGARR